MLVDLELNRFEDARRELGWARGFYWLRRRRYLGSKPEYIAAFSYWERAGSYIHKVKSARFQFNVVCKLTDLLNFDRH